MTRNISNCWIARRVQVLALVGTLGAATLGATMQTSTFAGGQANTAIQSDPYATASVDATVAPYTVPAASVGHDNVSDQAASQNKTTLFDMSDVERIRIRAWGNSELSGEYAIDLDNSLSIPRVGRIVVDGMTLADLELMLAQKLSSTLRTDMTVAVEVARYRPYYIMGQVTESGAMEWRPGLKVIQAISLARGVLRPEESRGVNRVEGRQSRTQLTFALAQLARLKAEREGGDLVTASQRIATLISSAPETNRLTLTNLMERQNDILSEQRNIMETQIEGLRRERDAAQREVESAETQEKVISEQLEITRAQLASIETLKDKKLVNNARYLDQKSGLLMIEVRYSEIKSQVERARARLSSVEQQLIFTPQQRRAELSERIDTLEREVAQLELASENSGAGEDDNNILKLTYHISRESKDGVKTFPATVFTEILPGDVLIVSDRQQDRIGAVRHNDGERPSLGGEKDANAEDAQRRIEDAATYPSQLYLRRASDDNRSR